MLELARAALPLASPESEVAPVRHPSPPPHDTCVSSSGATGFAIGWIEKNLDSVMVAILHARAVVHVHRANRCSKGHLPDTGHAARGMRPPINNPRRDPSLHEHLLKVSLQELSTFLGNRNLSTDSPEVRKGAARRLSLTREES